MFVLDVKEKCICTKILVTICFCNFFYIGCLFKLHVCVLFTFCCWKYFFKCSLFKTFHSCKLWWFLAAENAVIFPTREQKIICGNQLKPRCVLCMYFHLKLKVTSLISVLFSHSLTDTVPLSEQV